MTGLIAPFRSLLPPVLLALGLSLAAAPSRAEPVASPGLDASSLMLDPAASADAVRRWFEAQPAATRPGDEAAALVILKRLSEEAGANAEGKLGIGLRRSRDRRGLARDALAALAADGIDAPAIARRALDRLALQSAPADSRLVMMSEFLHFLPVAEEAERRLALLTDSLESLSPQRARSMLAVILSKLDLVETPEARRRLARATAPLVIRLMPDQAAEILAERHAALLDSRDLADLLSAVPTSPAEPALLAALRLPEAAARDRALLGCFHSALTAGSLLVARRCSDRLEHSDLRIQAQRQLAHGFLARGELRRAETVLAALMREAPAEAAGLAADVSALRTLQDMLDPAGITAKAPLSLPTFDLSRLPAPTRQAIFTGLLRRGMDVEQALAATPDPVRREALVRDLALAELATGNPVDAELRWRAMPIGRDWYRLGVSLYLAARLAEDGDLAGEIRSQLLVAASDGLSRFDADISALMLGLTGQRSDDYAVSPDTAALLARLASLDNPRLARGLPPDAALLRVLAEQSAATLDRFGLLSGRNRMTGREQVAATLESDPRNGGGVTITASVAPPALARPGIAEIDQRFLTKAHPVAGLPLPGKAEAALVTLNKRSGRYFENIIGTLSTRDQIFGAQRTIAPRFIRLMRGDTTLLSLRRQLLAEAADVISEQNGIVRLHVPIVIGPGARLMLDASEAQKIEIDSAAGAFIVNAGALDIIGVELSASAAPGDFRSFITAWSGSRTIIAGSVLTGLGYGGGSAHGLTIRSGPESMLGAALRPPSALIVDSTLKDMYSGFLSRAADPVVLVGNLLEGAAHGGLSPRDATRNFFAAYNTLRNNRGGPAIFVTNGVTGAVLIGNQALGNERAGLSVDLKSDGIVSYANRSAGNGGDGIALFESSCASFLMNAIEGNQKAGLKIRNSRDVGIFANTIADNRGAAIRAYVAAVPKLGGPAAIPALATLDAGWNLLGENGRGLSLEGVSAARLYANQFIRQSPRLFAGDLKGHAGRVLRDQQDGAAVIIASGCRPRRPNNACMPPAWLAELTRGLPGAFTEDGDADFCTGSAGSIQRKAIERSEERPAAIGVPVP